MRIAFFCWEYWPRLVGGLGTYAVEITRKFVELGHEVEVFTQNTGELKTSEEWNGIQIHRPLGIDLHSIFPLIVTEDLKRWGVGLKFFCDIFCYNHLSAAKFINELIRLKGQHFDVTVFHDWLSAIAGIVIKDELPQLPSVFHVHSTEQQRSGWKGSEIVKFLERQMAEKADKIVTVSYAMREHLVSIGYPPAKITVCWNGCDPEKYDPAKVDPAKVEEVKRRHGVGPNERVILFVGRLTWIKGVQNLVQAMPLVLKEIPNVKLIVLGKGEEYDYLVALTRRLGIEDKVSFRSEWVSEEERIHYYASADVCVFPSLSEPFGIVSLEAMAMEKPVVVGAGGISGFREQVIPTGPGKCGIHVDGSNPSDIAWGIKCALTDPEAERWGKNARQRVLAFFTWDKVARETLRIYEELVRS